MTSAVWALILIFRAPRNHFKSVILLSSLSMVIGIMGITSWTPFGSFPEIVWSHTDGVHEFRARSGWIFIAPVLTGVAALTLLGWKAKSPQ